MTLTELHDKLLGLGYKVETKDDALLVKLPLFSSVSVSPFGDYIRCEAKFGKLRRSTATWLNCILFPIALLFLWFSGSSFVFLAFIAFLFLSAELWDLYRYILTQNLINLVQRIWLNIQMET